MRRLVVDAATYGVAKAIPAAATVAGVALFVRLVGEDGYGRYSLLVATASVASGVGSGWINQGQLRFFSRYSRNPGPYLHAVRTARTVALVALAGLTGLGAVLAVADVVPLAPAGVLASGALAVALVFHTIRMATLQAQLQPRRVVRVETIRAVTYLAFPLALLSFFGTSYALLTVGVALSYGIGAWVVRPAPFPVDEGESGTLPLSSIARELWRYGWPMSLWLATSMAFQVTDRYLLQNVYSFEATGIYASAYDLVVRSFSLLFFPLTLAVHPRIMNAWNDGDRADGVRLIQAAFLGQIALYVPLLVGLLLAGPAVFGAMLGREVAAEQTALFVPLSLAGLSWQVALIAHKPLEVLGRTRTMLAVLVLVWVANVAANVVLLPHYGIAVTAYALAAAGGLYAALCFGLGWRGLVKEGDTIRTVSDAPVAT